jgi:sensor histidine kinase regulating citrate/malate metabolism
MFDVEEIMALSLGGFSIAAALILGIALGLAIGWFLAFRWRRDAMRLDEEKQILEQERQIVLEFMHCFVEAIGEGSTARSFSGASCTPLS